MIVLFEENSGKCTWCQNTRKAVGVGSPDVIRADKCCLKLKIILDDNANYCGKDGKRWCGKHHISYKYFTTITVPMKRIRKKYGPITKVECKEYRDFEIEYIKLHDIPRITKTQCGDKIRIPNPSGKYIIESKLPYLMPVPESVIIHRYKYIGTYGRMNFSAVKDVYDIAKSKFANLTIKDVMMTSVFFTDGDETTKTRAFWVYHIIRVPVATPELIVRLHLTDREERENILNELRSAVISGKDALSNVLQSYTSMTMKELMATNRADAFSSGFGVGLKAMETLAKIGYMIGGTAGALIGAGAGAITGAIYGAMKEWLSGDEKELSTYRAFMFTTDIQFAMSIIKSLPQGIFLHENYYNRFVNDRFINVFKYTSPRFKEEYKVDGILKREDLIKEILNRLTMMVQRKDDKNIDLYKTSDGKYVMFAVVPVEYEYTKYNWYGYQVDEFSGNRSYYAEKKKGVHTFMVIITDEKMQIYDYDRDLYNVLKTKLFSGLKKASISEIKPYVRRK